MGVESAMARPWSVSAADPFAYEISPDGKGAFAFAFLDGSRTGDGYPSEQSARAAARAVISFKRKRLKAGAAPPRPVAEWVEIFPGHRVEIYRHARPAGGASTDYWQSYVCLSPNLCKLVSWGGIVHYAIHDGRSVVFFDARSVRSLLTLLEEPSEA